MPAPTDSPGEPVEAPPPAASAAAKGTARRGLFAFLLLFVAPWVVYALILAAQTGDELLLWRGDVAWPAAHYLTVSQGGLWLPAFAHLMFAGIGSIFVSMVIGGLVRLACRLLRTRDRSGPVFPAILIVMQIACFAFFKAVPETVTTIDREAHRLEVHRFGMFLRIPEERLVIEADEILALEVDSYWRKRDGTRYLYVHALTRTRDRVLLGKRPCELSDEDPCLASTDAELQTLAAWLGHAERPVDSTRWPGHHVVLLTP